MFKFHKSDKNPEMRKILTSSKQEKYASPRHFLWH